MDGSNGGSNAPAPFLLKTYEMVEDPLTNSVVSWSQGGRSFVVWKPLEFAGDLLPKYFKHNNFSSFIRQLNTYGFRKIDPDQWEFSNEEFIRGKKHLLKNMYRRKPIHNHSGQGSSAVPLSGSERQEFEEEIERLKRDNSLLHLELEKHAQENHDYELEVGTLGQRLKDIDQRQRHLMAFLAQLLQKPLSAHGLAQQSENQSKKRRLLISSYLNDEVNMGKSQVATIKEENSITSFPMLNIELIEKLDSSLNFWENFMYGICQTSADEMYDFGFVPQPPPFVVTELCASSGDSVANIHPCISSSPRSSPSRDIHSSPDLAGSSNPVDSTAVSPLHLNLDSKPKSSGIDMNTRPAIFLDTATKDIVQGALSGSTSIGANDVFWQQFLTENPASSHVQEVHLERGDMRARMNENRLGDLHKPWWNMNNLDNLAEQMGNLTPAEKT